MSGRRDKYTREMSRVLDERNDDPMGKIRAKDMDGGGEVRCRNTAREMQRVRKNARAVAGFFASVSTVYVGNNAKGNADVCADGDGIWTNNGGDIE